MKKKLLFGISCFILGMIVSGISVYAAISLTSDKVGYKAATVKDSLDNLFDESVSGKNSITTALSNKGFNVNNNSTYTDIVNGINELPVTIGKDSSDNYGYYGSDGNFSSFNSSNCASGIINVDNIDYTEVELGFKPSAIIVTGGGSNYPYNYFRRVFMYSEADIGATFGSSPWMAGFSNGWDSSTICPDNLQVTENGFKIKTPSEIFNGTFYWYAMKVSG